MANELFEDEPNSLDWPAEAFLENAFEHDHELVEVHIVRSGASVEHQGAEEHINEQGIGDVFAENAAGGYGLTFKVESIMFGDAGDEFSEAIDLCGEGIGDLFNEEVELVGEEQRAAGERDGGSDLWAKVKVFPGHAELPQKFAERAAAGTGFSVVGDGVQADVVVAASQAVERVESADGCVPFEDADLFFVIGQSDSRGQPGHAGSDDDCVVSHWRWSWKPA